MSSWWQQLIADKCQQNSYSSARSRHIFFKKGTFLDKKHYPKIVWCEMSLLDCFGVPTIKVLYKQLSLSLADRWLEHISLLPTGFHLQVVEKTPAAGSYTKQGTEHIWRKLRKTNLFHFLLYYSTFDTW